MRLKIPHEDTGPPPSSELFHWIAINGGTLAVAPFALPRTFRVEPVPEMLVGFSRYEDALENEEFLLTAPSKEWHKRLADLRRRAAKGEVVVIRPEDPEPPARWGETEWAAGDEKDKKMNEEVEVQDFEMPPEIAAVKTKVMRITPQLAAELLKNNAGNRPLKRDAIDRYAADMKANRFPLNGESIILDRNGRMRDGQNRLTACVETGITFYSVVVSGVDEKVFPTINTGVVRTGGDVLFIGGEENSNELAATLKLVYLYETKGNFDRYLDRPSLPTTMLQEELEKHPQVRGHVAWAVKSFTKGDVITKPMLAFIRYVFCEVDAVAGEAFCSHLISGANLPEGHPVLVLNKRLTQLVTNDEKRTRRIVLAHVIKAWNAYRWDQKIKTLKFDSKDVFPHIEGSKSHPAPPSQPMQLSMTAGSTASAAVQGSV